MTPSSFIDNILIHKLSLSFKSISIDVPDIVRPVHENKIVMLAWAVSLNKSANEYGAVGEDGDSFAMGFVVFPLTMVACIVDTQLIESWWFLGLPKHFFFCLDVQVLIVELRAKLLIGFLCLFSQWVRVTLDKSLLGRSNSCWSDRLDDNRLKYFKLVSRLSIDAGLLETHQQTIRIKIQLYS